MNKIFITKANTNLILKSFREHLNIDKSRDFYLNELSENFEKALLNNIFNDNELKDIYYQKNILKNLDNLLKQVNNNQNIITNYIEEKNRLYAYDIKEPSYHNKNNCQWLNSDFHNIEIPKIIQAEHIKRKKFKKFIDKNKNLSFNELNILYKKEFDSSVNLKEINLKNSGNSSLDDIQFLIEVKDFIEIFLEDEEVKKIKYASLYTLDKILKRKKHSKIENYKNMKKDFLNYIFTVHKKKYNKDLSFDKIILENIGFTECHGCKVDNINYTNKPRYECAS